MDTRIKNSCPFNFNKIESKRGQGLSTNTIILLILGIVILVVLILGFTIGWDKLAPWISKDNVQTIVNQCATACTTGDTYGFCTKPRTLKAEGGETPGTCWYFSHDSILKERYGVGLCSSVNCEKSCDSSGGSWKISCSGMTLDGPFTDDPNDGKICCILPM